MAVHLHAQLAALFDEEHERGLNDRIVGIEVSRVLNVCEPGLQSPGELLTLPVVVDIAFVEPIRVLHCPDLLADKVVVRVQLQSLPPACERLLDPAGPVKIQSFTEDCVGLGMPGAQGVFWLFSGRSWTLSRNPALQDFGRLVPPYVEAAQLAETYDSLFVDEESVRNGPETVEVAQDVLLIDECGEPGAGPFDVVTRLVGRLRVYGD